MIPNDPHPVPLDVMDLYKEMQRLLPTELLDRLRSGTATHQELAIMSRLLKDNGLTLVAPPSDIGVDEPLELPEFSDESEPGWSP